jgi:hypothetical protein
MGMEANTYEAVENVLPALMVMLFLPIVAALAAPPAGGGVEVEIEEFSFIAE